MVAKPASLAIIFLMLPLAFVPVSPEQPPATGDWLVTQDTTVSGGTYYLEGNLTVKAGARLELYNVSIICNYSVRNQLGITVEEGAFLKIAESRIVNDAKVASGYLDMFGRIEVIDSSISYFLSSINIYDGSANFTGSEIFCCGYGIRCANSTSVNISECHFYGGYHSVDAYSAVVNISDSTIHGSIYAENCKTKISGCRFTEVPWIDTYAAIIEGATTIRDCYFSTGSGTPPASPLNASLAPPSSEEGVAVQACRFSGCNSSCILDSRYYTMQDNVGLVLFKVGRALVWNCTFAGMNYGILAGQISRASVEHSSFEATNQDTNWSAGIDASEFRKEDCLIRNNTFQVAYPIWVRGGTVEDNTLRASAGSYPGSFISCGGSTRVVRNRIIGPNESPDNMRGTGISLVAGSSSAEISDNVMQYLYCGIDCVKLLGKPQQDITPVVNNTIRDCEVGIWVKSEVELSHNNISATRYGIDGRSAVVRLPIHDNTIESLYTGIILTGGFQVTNNSVKANFTAIRLNHTDAFGPVNLSCNLSRNSIVSDSTGIEIIGMHLPNHSVSIDNNTITGCMKGISAERSNVSVMDNLICSITGWGFYSLDSNCRLARNSFEFWEKSLSWACREDYFWTVSVDAVYDTAPISEPERWVRAEEFWLKTMDGNGSVDFNDKVFAQRVAPMEDYSISPGGARIDRNPYVLIGNMTEKGTGSTITAFNAPCNVTLRLLKGIDLVAALPVVPIAPVYEGDTVSITAAAFNDGTYNPQKSPAANVELAITLDGKSLNALTIPLFSPGETRLLTAGWVATPGWHNLSFTIDQDGLIDETRRDNNFVRYPFEVTPVPKGCLTVNGRLFDLWEPVDFAISMLSGNDEASVFRFDFGDGESSGWIASNDTSHVYREMGNYTVHGWVAAKVGPARECVEPVDISVVFPLSAVDIYASPNPLPSRSMACFEARLLRGAQNLTAAAWDFGDGGYLYGAGLYANHTFSKPGNYTVLLNLTFDGRFSKIFPYAISVLNQPPTATGLASPEAGTVLTLFAFTSESIDPDGEVRGWKWDFGDGNQSLSSRTTHSYSRHGIYNVSLSVQDDWGDWSDPFRFNMTVTNLAPVISLVPDRTTAAPGERIGFDASLTMDLDDLPESLSFTWNFGDGSSGIGSHVSHAYSSPGKYIVNLTVADGAGGTANKNLTVSVQENAAPEPDWILQAAVLLGLIALSLIVYVIPRFLTRRHKETGHSDAVGKKNAGGDKTKTPQTHS